MVRGGGVGHGGAYNHENGHQQGRRGGVADEVGQGVTYAAGNQNHNHHVHGAERYGVDEGRRKSRLVESGTEGEASGDEPEHAPVDFLDVILAEHAGAGVDRQGNQGHDVGVDSGDGLGDPEQQGHCEGSPCHIGAPGLLVVPGLDMELYLLCLEGEEQHQETPCDQYHHYYVGHHVLHPAYETYLVAGAFEGAERDCVGGSPYRGAHSAEVGRDGNRQRKSHPSGLIVRKRLEHGGQERQHHGGSGGVAHEH